MPCHAMAKQVWCGGIYAVHLSWLFYFPFAYPIWFDSIRLDCRWFLSVDSLHFVCVCLGHFLAVFSFGCLVQSLLFSSGRMASQYILPKVYMYVPR